MDILHQITDLMDRNDFYSALTHVRELQAKWGTNPTILHNSYVFLMDIGNALCNECLVKESLSFFSKTLCDINEHTKNATLYYSHLANGYSALYGIKKRRNPYYSHFRETELDNAKYYFRLAIKTSPSDCSQHLLKMHVNLGNCYDYTGRNMDALECYDKAVCIASRDQSLLTTSDYGMAISNRGVALSYFALLTEEMKRKCDLMKESYKFIGKGTEIGVFPEAREGFIQRAMFIEGYMKNLGFSRNALLEPMEPASLTIDAIDDFEKHYIYFCLNNGLFLNPCNPCRRCNYAIGDSICLPEEINIKNNTNIRTYLNEIKNGYVTARLQAAIFLYHNFDFSPFDRLTRYEPDDYRHDIKVGLLKNSLWGFFCVLDKTAQFINEYLELGEKERDVTFNRIWHDIIKDEENRVISNPIKDGLLESGVFSFNAIYDIYKDFQQGNEYEELRSFRNKITHRYLPVSIRKGECGDGISEERLLENTLLLARITRNCVIYLIQAVYNGGINLQDNRNHFSQFRQ